MLADMELFKHQQDFLTQNPARHLLLFETGTGKTLTSILWAVQNMADERTLVICPKMLVENWKRNCDVHGNERFTVISKEQFKKYKNDIPAYRCVIIDEVHNHAGHTSQLHKATVAYLNNHNIQFILGLTATPYSGPWNVYGMAAIMRQPMNWFKFKHLFFYEVKMGYKTIPKPRLNMEPQLIELLHRFGTTVKLVDCVDMPESVYETEYFSLTLLQTKMIENAYDPLPVTRFSREHQITGGTLKGDEYEEPKTFDCPKAERLLELIREHPQSIVVCRYLHEMESLSKSLGAVRPVYTLSGQTKDRDGVIQSLKIVENYCLIVQAQCSEGWELPACPVVIFYSMSWRFVDRIQLEGRIRRINNPKKNLYITLVVKDSADEAVYDCIEKKQDFQCELYEGKRLSNSSHPMGKAHHHS